MNKIINFLKNKIIPQPFFLFLVAFFRSYSKFGDLDKYINKMDFNAKSSLDLGCGSAISNPFNARELFGADIMDIDVDNVYKCTLGIEELPYAVSVAVSLFVFIVVVNSLNLIDGIDGLASLLSLKFFFVVGAILSVSSKEMELVVPAVVGALVGFLAYNFNPNKKVFLGDTGSLLLGSVMAFFIFYTLNSSSFIVTDGYMSRPLFVILLLIYPLADTLRAFVIRVYKKQSPFVADRIHLHHRLLNKGISHWRASVTILISSISVLLVGFLLSLVFPLGITVMILFVYLSVLYYTIFK